ncbi:MAG TPA: hypothetical protein VLD37_03725 [Candidatus Bilamarchaeum sp.]|nr:hypothetical protein [Candidatus Bilamarchaeum sp.]
MVNVCPKCGSSEVVPAVWPFPDKETKKNVGEGQLIATCNSGVTRGCRKCGHTW